MTPGADARTRARGGYSALQLQPFDFSQDILSGILEVDLPSGPEQGGLVAVRASPAARHKDWAAHAAVAIATNWAAQGARVLLVDLFFDEPHLHRAFGARNREGITDAIAYGVSLRRIARPVDDGAFWVATSGTPMANPRGLLNQPQWHGLLATLVEGGITVVAYQAAESLFQPRGTPSIVLACKGEPMATLGRTGLRDAIALLGPAPTGTSVTMVARKRENRLGKQAYQASLWEGFEDGAEAAEEDVPDSAAVDEPAAAVDEQTVEPAAAADDQTAEPAAATDDQVAEPAAAVDAPTSAPAAPVASGSRVNGRGLSVSAFVVLVLFATLMVMMGIENAGIAEVPWADRLWELFESLLARISEFFV